MTLEADDWYDPFAVEFEQHAQAGAYNALYDRPAMFDLLGNVRGKRILDAGCGPGLYAEELVRRGAAVTAFDSSAEMVRLAQGRLGPSVDVRGASFSEPLTWLADESYDLAVMALVLHHLNDRRLALCEIFRVLRPCGHLVLSTVHPTSDWLRKGGSYFTTELIQETWRETWEVRCWRQPLQGWCEEIRDAGFVIERLVEPRPLPEMADAHQRHYENLLRQPEFIAFRLMKLSEADRSHSM